MLKDKPIPISPESLTRFNDFVSQQIGLNFKETRWSELERGIRQASQEFGYNDPEKYIQWLISSPSPLSKKQIEVLSVYLTVGETYFFREKEALDVLESHVLPEMVRAAAGKPGSLRIWSTACSSGEEAYSIAIIIDQKKQLLKNWDITILATDINSKSLEKAETGVYSEWSMRSTPAWIKQQYFSQKGKNAYEIKHHIKQMVTFAYLNLVEDVYPSLLNNTNAMDIIFCRNVLMYFLHQKAETVVRKLYHSLVMGGWLMVAPTDAFHFMDIECFKRFPSKASVFNKCDKKKAAMEMEVQTPPRVNILEPELPTPADTAAPPDKKESKDTAVNDNIQAYAQALQLYQQGNYPQVIAQLQDMAHIKNQDPVLEDLYGDIYALLARSFANLGQLDQAVHWCEKALESDKLNPGYRYLLVTIFQEQGNETAALQALKKCLYIDPNFILAHFTLGNILDRQKKVEESRKHLNIALSLLEPCGDNEVVSMEDGLTAGRLREIIKTTVEIRKGVAP